MKFISLFSALAVSSLLAAPDTVDPTFQANAGTYFDADSFGGISSSLVQPDGKIIFGSNEMPALGDTKQVSLLRLNPDGTLDTDFQADNDPDGAGNGILYVGQGWPEVHAVDLQSDGKIIAAGVMNGYKDDTLPSIEYVSSILRFNADGSYDDSFLAYGTQPDGGLNYIEEIAIQPDDKILCMGGFRGFRGKNDASYATRYGIARLNADGSLDTSFEVSPQDFAVPLGAANVSGFFRQASVAPDGDIYVIGEWSWGTSFPKESLPVLARLNADGSRDFSFNPTLPTDLSYLTGIALEPNGELTFLAERETGDSIMLRYTPSGGISSSFNLASGLGLLDARPLRRDPTGKFLLTSRANTSEPRNHLIRLNNDGSIDSSFEATAAWVTDASRPPFFSSFITSADGSIYSGAFFDRVEGETFHKIVKFEGDAIPSSPGTILMASFALSVNEEDGSLLIPVTRTGGTTGAASIDYSFSDTNATNGDDYTGTSGTITFPAGIGGTKYINVPITIDTDVETVEVFSVTLSNATGAVAGNQLTTQVTILDSNSPPQIISQPFGLEVSAYEAFVLSVGALSGANPVTYQWQRDGVDIPGATDPLYFISNADPAADHGDYTVTVTNRNGSVTSSVATIDVLPVLANLDPSFSISGVNQPGSFVLLPDDSALMLDGNSFNGYTLRKLDSTFTADPAFTVTTTPSGNNPANQAYPNPIPLPNGQLLVRGSFSQVNGEDHLYLARLNADGTVDPSFNAFFNDTFQINGNDTYIQFLTGVGVTADGSVHVMVRSATQGSRLYRLNSDGSIDDSFDHPINYSTNAYLDSFLEVDDGSILIGYTAGGFGSLQRGIRKIRPDGSLDPDFNHSTGYNGNIVDMEQLPDGRIAVIYWNKLEFLAPDGTVLETHTFTTNPTSLNLFRGRLLITGINEAEGTTLPGVALFSLDGTLDSDFPGGPGPDGNVIEAEIDSSGRIIVQGSFTSWNGTPAPGIARLVIDRAEISLASGTAQVMENAGPLTIELVRYGDTSSLASVRVTSTDGSALAGADYLALDEVVTWAAGDSSPKSVSLTLIDDPDIEPAESLTLHLSEASGGAPVITEMAITLLDDDSLPQITQQPLNVAVLDGNPASFTVAATSPEALSYQWFFNGQAIAGATADTYSLPMVTTAEEGDYHVVLTNLYGSTTSATAKLEIIPDPTLISPLYSNPATWAGGTIFIVVPAPDGGAYLGGSFINFDGDDDRDYLVKINEDGSVDEAFDPPLLTSSVTDMALSSSGDLIVVGSFPGRVLKLAADGTEDTSFSSARGTGGNEEAKSVALLPDGTILVAGDFLSWNGTTIAQYNLNNSHVVRLNPDGTLHPVRYPNPGHSNHYNIDSNELKVLPDGSFLVSYDSTSSSYAVVRRYQADGSEVTSFNYSFNSPRVDHIDVFPDGDYLFAGDNSLYKVSPTGSVVASYDTSSDWFTAEIQIDGKLIASRNFNQPRVSRYLTDQQTDPSYNMGSKFPSNVHSLALRPDGRLWAAGQFSSFNGISVPGVVLLDNTLIPLAISSQPGSLVLDPGSTATFTCEAVGTSAISYQWSKDGDLLPGETSPSLTLPNAQEADEGSYTCTVTNGSGSVTSQTATLDVLGAPEITALSPDASAYEGSSISLTVEAFGAGTLAYQWRRDGSDLPGETDATLTLSPVQASEAGSYQVTISNSLGSIVSDPIIVTVTPNLAAVQPDFTALTLGSGSVYAILPLADGNALVGGDFTSLSDGINTSGARLALVSPAGEVLSDSSLSANSTVYDFFLQADGKILLTGNFTDVNGSPRGKAARLNSDLTLDTSFVPVNAGFGTARAIIEDTDGKVVISGEFFNWNGLPDTSYLVRLNSDGSHDDTFKSYAGSYVRSLQLLPNNQYLLGGWILDYNGQTNADGLVQINNDGTAVTPPPYAPGFFYSDAALLSSTGDLYSANAFGNDLRKYSPTGTNDPTFWSSINANGKTLAIAETPDGKILLGGDFTTAHAQTTNRITLVNPDGTAEPAFRSGTGFDASVRALAPTTDGTIWVGGSFANYNGEPFPGLILLKGSSQSISTDPWDDFIATLPPNEQGEDDDPDGDGLDNLLEFAYGTSPDDRYSSVRLADSSNLIGSAEINTLAPGSNLPDGEIYYTVTYRFPDDSRGVTLTPQATMNLPDFSDGSAQIIPVGDPVDDGDYYLQRYYLTPSRSTATRAFTRLQAIRN
ncbi:MAG: immunoglobulin domain-containing protein [Verrucomicrobiota bacterium JB023]|nr:immunoglobulin domain-containing protein [Verrucomicrobiota bacterium JB023]